MSKKNTLKKVGSVIIAAKPVISKLAGDIREKIRPAVKEIVIDNADQLVPIATEILERSDFKAAPVIGKVAVTALPVIETGIETKKTVEKKTKKAKKTAIVIAIGAGVFLVLVSAGKIVAELQGGNDVQIEDDNEDLESTIMNATRRIHG